MARRKRPYITPASKREVEYTAGVEAGAVKYDKKLGDMKIGAKGGLAFTAALDELINGVLARRGLFGQSTIKYYIVGRKLAKLIVGNSDRPDNVLADVADRIIQSYTIQEGIDIDVARDIAAELIRKREELRMIYGLG